MASELQVVQSNNDNSFILTFNKCFALVSQGKFSDTFSEADGERIYKILTSLNVNKMLAKMNAGTPVPEKDKTLFINTDITDLTVNPISFQLLQIKINTVNMNSWHLHVHKNWESLCAPDGMVDDIFRYLKSIGCEPSESYKKYDKMIRIDKLPVNPTLRMAYLLSRQDGKKAADTVWVWTGKRYEMLADNPVNVPADPTDSDTIPDSIEKQPVDAEETLIGGTEEVEATLYDAAVVDLAVEMKATELAAVVNSVINDAALKITVQ